MTSLRSTYLPRATAGLKPGRVFHLGNYFGTLHKVIEAQEKDRPLLNIYSVMEVNPANGPRVNAAGGKAFAEFMLAPETQQVIKTFGVDRYGQPLFVPIAGKKDEDF